MNVGESVTSEIRAGSFWNKTGIHLVGGQRHLMTASGHWVDFFIRHEPDGDPSDSWYLRLFETKRRLAGENWFVLVGALDSDRPLRFASAHSASTSPRRPANFANDVPGFYWNNLGHVTVIVRCTG